MGCAVMRGLPRLCTKRCHQCGTLHDRGGTMAYRAPSGLLVTAPPEKWQTDGQRLRWRPGTDRGQVTSPRGTYSRRYGRTACPRLYNSQSMWVTSSGADSQSVQYVPFVIWTICKACTFRKIKDHSWKPGHKLELGRQNKICNVFL